ncbi:hypothetical protein Pint_10774 [Pistacia integerrima]|uniref:Uncharacterized protein n=1 Tax=Pistacia integerrima TaxID=434235 RepID=A0ACC0XII7_9ROSI|nr:hypothetical protein Pint_10774 [Pistacia integerrima]
MVSVSLSKARSCDLVVVAQRSLAKSQAEGHAWPSMPQVYGMAEDLDELYASLSLTEKENEAVVVALDVLQDVLRMERSVDLEKGEVEWGAFMQVRVMFNVTEPLLRGSKLSIGGANSVCIRVWLRAGSFTKRKNHGRSCPYGLVNLVRNNGEGSGDTPFEEMVGEVQVVGDGDATAVGGVSPKADRSYNGVVETKMVTELMATIIMETRADSQKETLPGKELHGNEGSGILQDPLQSYTLADILEDSNLLEGVGSQRILNEGGPYGPQQQVSPKAAMGLACCQNLMLQRKQRKFEEDDLCKVGKKSKPESYAMKVGEAGVDTIPMEDDDLLVVGIRNLYDLVKREGPDVLFLQEIAIGRKGGIALMWGKDVDLTILNYSDFHVNATVLDFTVNGGKWFVTAVYGYPKTHLCYKTWDLLRRLCRSRGESWLMMGDLNEILFHHEKMGGKS